MRVLDADADRARWCRLWEQCGSEPFAHPAYGRLVAQPGERPVALELGLPGGAALLPLILRPVPGGHHDATSPYGYGGPFFAGAADLGGVLDAVTRWAASERLCSVFLRLSPGPAPAPRPDVVAVSRTVVVDLRRDPEQLWRGYEHKVRKNVRKAQRAGCTVHHLDLSTEADDFLRVYAATMRRRAAAAWYHFGRDFFAGLATGLAGSWSAFAVRDADGRTVSAELVLESERHLYSYLGGTLEDAFPMAPNDLLKHEIAGYGAATGRHGFVLGGGHRDGDGIFRYKRSFDPQGVRPFHVARIIGDRRLYADLVRHRGAAGTEFFPAYRAP